MVSLLIVTLALLAIARAIHEIPNLRQVTLPVDHGEGPTWDSRTGMLYFVDLHNGRVLAYEPSSNRLTAADVGGDLTPVVPTRADPGRFIVGVNRSVAVLDWDPKTNQRDVRVRVLTTVAEDKPTSRFNDGKADSEGRLWFGSMGFEDSNGVVPDNGAMYFITKENLAKPKEVIKPVNVSNGLAWNYANDKFYYIDSPARQIREYDYDSKTGNIANGRVIFDLRFYCQLQGVPDGMTIDVDNNLWIALYQGGAVIKISPKTRKLLKVLKLPATYVTSVAWGGDNLDTLYVTTSRFIMNEEERRKEPKAGSLFALTNLGTRGLPANDADILD